MKYLTDLYITSITITELPRYGRSKTGYGSKIPTEYMIGYAGRRRRVFAKCFSNVASHFVVCGRENLYLPPETLSRIEDAKDRI